MNLHGRNIQGGSLGGVMPPQVAGPATKQRSTHRPAATASDLGFSRAIECLHHGEWQAAFDAMAQAADRGDRRAARIALLMLQRGPRLFSQRFGASPAQRTRWAEDSAQVPQATAHETRPTD